MTYPQITMYEYTSKSSSFHLFCQNASVILAFFLILSPLTPVFAQENSNENSLEESSATQKNVPSMTVQKSEKGDKTQMMSSSLVVEGGTMHIHHAGLNSQAPNVNLQTGAMEYMYSLVIPPGRNGMTPDLKLSYNSNNRNDSGKFGYGWNISIPFIQRVNKSGIGSLYASTTFESSIDGELVKTGATTYMPKVDDGSFRKYEFASSTWTITEKNGVKHYFGTTSQSRQSDPADGTRVFAWLIEESRDKNSNYISYSYYKETGDIYPDQITYTGNEATPGIFTISFGRESRGDTIQSYGKGFSATTSKRISGITASINGNWVKKYTLGYTTGHNGTRSMLASITEEGRDDDLSLTTSLPATTFAYEKYGSASKSWETIAWDIPEDFIREFENYDDGVRALDFNGDGLTDIIRSDHARLNDTFPEVPQQKLYLNTGSGFATTTDWILPVPLNRFAFTGYEPISGAGTVDLGARFADANGDGYVDILWGYYTCAPGHPVGYCYDINYVYLNNKINGWATSTQYELPLGMRFVGNNRDEGVIIADLNGDSLPDFLISSQETNNNITTYTKNVQMNTGSGWASTTTLWNIPEPFEDQQAPTGTQVVDVNNDGLADIVRSFKNSNGTFTRRTHLNNGAGWVEAGDHWDVPLPFAVANAANNGAIKSLSTRFIDINGDGLVDVFDNNTTTNGANSAVYINTGNGWVLDSQWTNYLEMMDSYSNNGVWHFDLGVRLFDLDGDNMLDMVKAGPTASYPTGSQEEIVRLHKGSVPDLLITITRPEGATTSIGYLQSALYRDTNGNMMNPKLPYILNTVSTTTYNDGINEQYEQSMTYASGTHYFASTTDKQFAGFEVITQKNNFGKEKYYFHQGNGDNATFGEQGDHPSKIGLKYKTEFTALNDALYSIAMTNYATSVPATGSTYVKRASDVQLDYDGDGDHKDWATTYVYNNSNGSLSTMTQYGEVNASTDGTFSDKAADTKFTNYTYATNSAGMVLLSQQTLINNGSTTISDIRNYYDNQSLGVITLGNLTKREDLVEGSTYIDTEWAYNGYGLKTSETDPRNYVTSYTYDSNNLYPATTTNPLSQTIATLYDYSSGKIATTSDSNGGVHAAVYDGVDRVLEIKEPRGSSGAIVTVESNTYTDNRGEFKILNKKHLSGSNELNNYVYLDGYGRKIQERQETETNGQYAVRDTVYGKDGKIIRESLPYFANNESRSSATAEEKYYTTYAYDPLGRQSGIGTILGTTTMTYDQWVATTTDTLSNVKAYEYDAYKRLVNVYEKDGSNTYKTSYLWTDHDQLDTTTDALGNIRQFTYDGLGRRLTAQDLHTSGDATFGTWTYAYDASGNLSTTTDPKSQVAVRGYDALNRPTSENYTGLAGIEATFIYDTCTNGKGFLCTSQNSSATTTRTYSLGGLMNSESKTIGTTTFTHSYEYDYQNNQTKITYPDNSDVKYSYNTAGQLERIEQRENGGAYRDIISNFNYSPLGQITYQLHGNGVNTTREYDDNELYRLRSITTLASSTGTGGPGSELLLLESALGLNEAYVSEIIETEDDSAVLPDSEIPVLENPIEEIPPEIEIPSAEEAASSATSTEENTPPEEPLPEDEEFIATTTPGENGGSISPEITPTPTTTPESIPETTSTPEILPEASTTPEIIDLLATTSTSTVIIVPEKRKVKDARIELLLEGKNPHERKQIKAHELALLNIPAPFTVPEYGDEIEIVGLNEIDGGIQVFVKAWRDKKPLGFGSDGSVEIERLRIFNPPILARKNGELVEDLETALKDSVGHIVSVIGQVGTQISVGKVGNTTTTVYPDAGSGGTTIDGRMFEDRSNSWSTTITNGSCRISDPTNVAVDINSSIGNGFGGSFYSNNRIHFGFDTSVIPDTDEISTTTFSIKATATHDTVGSEKRIYLVSSSPASNNSLTTSDYSSFGGTSLGVTNGTWATSSFNSITLNPDGVAYVNKTGVTNFMTRTWYDINGVTPDNSNELIVYAYNADQTGTTDDPKLIIQHAAPAPTSTPGSLLQKILYTYDLVGNITKIVNNSETDSRATTTYAYDDLYRLTSASTTQASSTPYSQTYTYSAIGNMSAKSDVGSYTYSGHTGSLYANPHAPTSVNGVTYTYDFNGNLATTSASLTNTWDYKNRLTQVVNGSTTTTYIYDVDTQRVRKVVGGVTTTYPSQFYETKGATTTKHVYIPGGGLVATLEGTTSTSTTHIYHTHLDHLESTDAVTNEASIGTQILSYYPFGSLRVDESYGGTDVSKKFTGHELDRETDLTYAGARYLNSDIGKWISMDPASRDNPNQFLRDPQQFNSYSYARNNPLILFDPDGEKVELVARPVFTSHDAHFFYLVTPDNPSEISIDGIPAGTEKFTIGAYNRGGFAGVGNKLTPEFGYEGGPQNTDSPYLTGEKAPTASTQITLPDGMSDSDFINRMGQEANSINKVNYFTFGKTGKFGVANSNNFVNEVGTRSGIGTQVQSFNPSNVYIPGKNQGVPTSNLLQNIQNQINQIREKLKTIGDNN